jgi:ribulose-phosphate 3-epimerase
VEAVRHLHRSIMFIRSLGALAGAVINPATPAGALEAIASELDFVVVMSVNPGFGGQKFIRHSYEKIRQVRALLAAAGSSAPIEVDGGVDLGNIDALAAAGASIFVAGNAIFGTPDAEASTRALRARAGQTTRADA